MTTSEQSGKTPWYVRAFSADYSSRYKHRSDAMALRELPFLVDALNLPARPWVLDLCCGAGRHTRAMVEALDNGRVVGLDLSADLLHQAQRKRTQRKRRIFIRGDMRRLPLATASFNGAVNLFTSFGYFKTHREHLNVLKEVARVLKPGGRFVIDFFNGEWVLPNLVPHSESEVKGTRTVQTRRYDRRSKRILKTIRISHKNAATRRWKVVETLTESVRAYAANDLKDLLMLAGLKPLSLHGDLEGNRYTPDESPRCVWVSEK
jgi:ubiquinone/menaquinone biosynthesis C-methylase UbiE